MFIIFDTTHIMYNHFLITGGAGFVGSNLGLFLKRDHPHIKVTALDNLKRRGSELNLPRLRKGGVNFIHGDIRNREDLKSAGSFDCILECSAESSVLAGYQEVPDYVINTNLIGTINCLETARRNEAAMIFLSTSRVYPIETINRLNYVEGNSRFKLTKEQSISGVSDRGIAESFPLDGPRSLYGATKLCSEFLIQEYVAMYDLKAVINRCGVLTGPWQMGKVDQGIVTHWIAQHVLGGKLTYLGYGGTGKQVRDILHIEDLYRLLLIQMDQLKDHKISVYNVGGGHKISLSLLELTRLCEQVTGKTLSIGSVLESRKGDIPLYLSDCSKVMEITGWEPIRLPETIVEEIAQWITNHRDLLQGILS